VSLRPHGDRIVAKLSAAECLGALFPALPAASV
jgi:hypothetical protein